MKKLLSDCLLWLGFAVVWTTYNTIAWAYVTGLVWSWSIGHELGITLSFKFWVGVMFLLQVAKLGLKNSIEDKNGKELGSYLAVLVVLPWLALLIFWLVLS